MMMLMMMQQLWKALPHQLTVLKSQAVPATKW